MTQTLPAGLVPEDCEDKEPFLVTVLWNIKVTSAAKR